VTYWTRDLLVEIIETLEACGLEDDSYPLHDYVDPDALEQVIASTMRPSPFSSLSRESHSMSHLTA